MSNTFLTFNDNKLLHSALIGPDGAVHYTFSTTRGLLSRKCTTITAASGLVGLINWREKTFVLGGLEQRWSDLTSEVAAGPGLHQLRILRDKEWRLGDKSFKLEYYRQQHEYLATPIPNDFNTQPLASAVRFTTYRPHLLQSGEPAAISFPHQMQDEVERMFVLMALLQTEIHRQDAAAAASAAAG